MNLYIASPDSQDAQLVADRLMDQDVSALNDENESNVFALYVNGCQIDAQSGAWKSSKGKIKVMLPQRNSLFFLFSFILL